MNIFNKLIILLLVLCSICLATTININGITYKEYKTLLTVQNKDTSLILVDIKHKLDSLGYLNHNIFYDSNNIIKGNSGQKCTISNIFFSGNSSFNSEHLLNISEIKINTYFNSKTLDAGINSIIEHYSNNGFLFCDISIDSLRTNNNLVNIYLNIKENGQYFIDKINILGNVITKTNVITRELPFFSGDTFADYKLDEALNKIERLGFFTQVKGPYIYLHQRRRLIDATFEVSEAKTISAEGAIGYDGEKTWAGNGLIGTLNLNAINILGTGRISNLQFSQDESFAHLYFDYTEPWLFNNHINTSTNINMDIQRDVYAKRDLGLNIKYFFKNNWNTSLIICNQELSETYLKLSSTSFSGGFSLEYDVLDYPINPLKGYRVESTILSSQKNKDSNIFNEFITSLCIENILQINKSSVFYSKVFSQAITSPQKLLLRTERFFVGGSNSVRGYSQRQFSLEKTAWCNLELRYLSNKRSRIYIFSDAGTGTYKEENLDQVIETKTVYLLSFGLGLRMPVKIGFFGFDIGYNAGSTLRDIKIHAQIKTFL